MAIPMPTPSALSGIRVLDFSPFLPGPFCTQMLADLGADVVKVEPPAGDPVRRYVPDVFFVANRGKRSVVLDLKTPDGRAAGHQLAAAADVVVEGFRPGVAARLGIDYATLSALNPLLVYCSISGYGQSGPDALAPGHDVNYLAMAGAFGITGQWGAPPSRSGLPVGDLAAAMYAAVAILAGLRARDQHGVGQLLDLSMTDCMLGWTSARSGRYLVGEALPTGNGWPHLGPANDVFETADGRSIALGILEDHFWENLVRAVADLAPELADPRFREVAARQVHGDVISAALKRLFRTRPRAEWLERFAGADVPVTAVLSAAEAIERAAERRPELVPTVEDATAGRIRQVLFPVGLSATPARARGGCPPLGAHTAEVLREAGWRPRADGRGGEPSGEIAAR